MCTLLNKIFFLNSSVDELYGAEYYFIYLFIFDIFWMDSHYSELPPMSFKVVDQLFSSEFSLFSAPRKVVQSLCL